MGKANRLVLAIAACSLIAIGLSARAQESEGNGADFEPVVSVMELMQQTITPATNQIWSAWEEPSTPAEWRMMEEAAITLLAASSLSATGGTGPMDNDWVEQPAWQAFNSAMITAASENDFN